ncbi:MAG: metal ABC transporter permease [Actinomycetota bacterium]
MLEMLELGFMQRALVAGALAGAVAPLVGTFVVQRRLSLIGDGLGHIAFAGVGAAIFFGLPPLALALAFCLAGALGVERMRRRSPEEADMALAFFFYVAIAGGVVLTTLAGSFNAGLLGVLFGQVLTVSRAELMGLAAVGAGVLSGVAVLYRGLLAAALDEDAAEAGGLPVRALNMVLMALVGATVAVGMRVVGVLLIAALMVLPVAAARMLAGSFRAAVIGSSVTGAAVAVGGIVAAYHADTPPAATIVLVAAAVVLLAQRARTLRSRPGRRRRVRPPAPST